MNNNPIKISVCIPVYGVEKYIELCAHSLMRQTLKNGIEFIFINDCTKDNSIEILKRVISHYPLRKNQCHIIENKTNLGIAATRNEALKYATGEYIIYCDSDDWVEENMYECMYSEAKIKNADVVGCDFVMEYVSKSDLIPQKFLSTGKECVKSLLNDDLHCGTWNKLIKREIYIKSGIRFPSGINMWEDVATIIPLMYFCDKVCYINQPLYHYRQTNITSYTKAKTHKSLIDMTDVISILEKFFTTIQNSEFLHLLNFKKLTVKSNLLYNSCGQVQKKWCKIYPEVDEFIWSFKKISMPNRIALMLNRYGCLWGYNMIRSVSKLLN